MVIFVYAVHRENEGKKGKFNKRILYFLRKRNSLIFEVSICSCDNINRLNKSNILLKHTASSKTVNVSHRYIWYTNVNSAIRNQ